MTTPPAELIALACASIHSGTNLDEARDRIGREYPFTPSRTHPRNLSVVEVARTFARDGFVDRYSGDRLVFPGVLRLLSHLMPDVFPFHPNWKRSATHPAYWELYPTVDHVVPVARGGPRDPCPSNWATTSMLRNSAKADWTLEELGWELRPPGDPAKWDGQVGWFRGHMLRNPQLKNNPALRHWFNFSNRIHHDVQSAIGDDAPGGD